MHWKASSGPGNDDGISKVWVDDEVILDLTALDNDTRTANGLLVGNRSTDDASSAMTIRGDNFKLGTTTL